MADGDLPGPLVNTVTVSGTVLGETTVVTDSASASIDLASTPGIAVLKTASIATAQPGDAITYSYLVTNTGDVTLDPVVAVDDALGSITLESSSLAPGAAATGSASYTVQPDDLANDPLVNTVTVTGTTSRGEEVTASASASVTLAAGPNTPTVVTHPAINVLSTTATLSGTVNPNGLDTTARFRWGETPGGPYPNEVPIVGTLTGNVSTTIFADLTGLTPDTTYYYIAAATNADGAIAGNEQRFTTLPASGPGYASTPAAGSTLAVGEVISGTTGTVDLVVREVGSADLTVSLPAGALSGADAGSFSVTAASGFPFTITDGSGETETLSIGCTPQRVGTLAATLTLATNDPEQPTVSYNLTCTAIEAGPPTLYLPIVLRNAGGN